MADKNTIARPYARAAFQVAQENDALDELSRSLGIGKELLSDGRISRFLANPALTDDERLQFLKELFATAAGEDSVFGGSSEHGMNFLKLLLEYGRVDVLPEISDRFDALKAEVENTVDVIVTSATKLSDAQMRAIETALRARLGRDINLSTKIDENLIAGAVIRAGDVVIDGSLRSRLEGLSNALVA
jgi:F-type H+-transporting ATPase subunit delta